MEKLFPANGTILATCIEESGDNLIAASFALPESAWNEVTEWINDLSNDFSPVRADLPVRERISLYLDLIVQIIMDRANGHREPFGSDLNDDVPF